MKPVSGRCNLNCEYCFYKHVNRGTMPIALVERVMSQCPQGSTLGWHGGEPTLAGLDFYKHVVGLRRDINHTLMTNATLIDENWARFLAKENFLVGVSIDGPSDLHRVFRSEWRKTVKGLRFLQRYNVDVNAVVTVNRANWNHGVKVYRALKKLGITYMQFIPIYGNVLMQDRRPYGYCIDGHEWGVFLISVFREWLKNGIGEVNISLFDDSMLAVMGKQPRCCVQNAECGGFVVEADGFVYPCEHFISDVGPLGNIYTDTFEFMTTTPAFKVFLTEKISAASGCNLCRYVDLCGGGCRKHRTILRFSKNMFCDGYKRFFEAFLAEVIPQR